MDIFVKSITSKTIALRVEGNDRVSHLKEKIFMKEGIKTESQSLIYSGKQMQDDRTLNEYGVRQDATIHLVLRLLGGSD